MISLEKLVVGQQGRVVTLDATNAVDQRLMALGLLPDMVVKLVRIAPLGDPIAVEFLNQCISLRKSEAAGIKVDPFPVRKKSENE